MTRFATILTALSLVACADAPTPPSLGEAPSTDAAAVPADGTVGESAGPIQVDDPSSGGMFASGVRYVDVDDAAHPLQLTVWYPAVPVRMATHWDHSRAVLEAPVADHQDWPVVLLSHGDGQSPEALAYLGDHLASRGYVVVAPFHPDAAEREAGPVQGLQGERISALSTSLDAIEAVVADAADPLHGRVDLDRVAVIGQGAGGLAAEQIVAAPAPGDLWSPVDARVGLAISLAACGTGDHGGVLTPILYFGGAADAACRSDEVAAAGALAEDAELVVIDGATHLSFTDAAVMGEDGFRGETLTTGNAKPTAEVHEIVQGLVTAYLASELPGEDRVLIGG